MTDVKWYNEMVAARKEVLRLHDLGQEIVDALKKYFMMSEKHPKGFNMPPHIYRLVKEWEDEG